MSALAERTTRAARLPRRSSDEPPRKLDAHERLRGALRSAAR